MDTCSKKQKQAHKRTRAQAAATMAILCITTATNIHFLQSVPKASGLISPIMGGGKVQAVGSSGIRSRRSRRTTSSTSGSLFLSSSSSSSTYNLNSAYHKFPKFAKDGSSGNDYSKRKSSLSRSKLFRPSSTSLKMSPAYIQLFTGPDKDQSDPESNENARARWLSWMTGGTPRGVADVKMRDPDALGGIPRADRYASRDWLHNTINLANSAILKSIRFPVLFMTCWGTAISLVHRELKVRNQVEMAARMCIPTQPHSLMVSALGLLLVFRTNSAYQRFAEGRKIWEDILSVARDLSRLGKLYEPQIGVAKLRRVNRLLAAFPYLLRFRIKPNSIMRKLDDPDVQRDPEFSLILYQDHATSDSDMEAAAVASDEETTGMSRRKPRELYWVDKRTLPWRLLPSPEAMGDCARSQNRPLWVCDRLSKELHSVPDQDNWTARERLTLLAKVEKLSGTIGACERIHQTVVPLNYARHALRSLTMWLLSLPFALVKDTKLMTGPLLFVISWMLFGVYEIGYSIEDPFQGTLRLSILCDAIRRDVLGDELIRNTAFILDKEASQASKRVLSSEGATEVSVIMGDDFEEEYEDDDPDDFAVEIEEIVIDELGNAVESMQEEVSAANTKVEEKDEAGDGSIAAMESVNGNAAKNKVHAP